MMPRHVAKTSIRSSSSRSKVVTPALHTIIKETHAEGSAIHEYFRIKKKYGSRAVPEPRLDGDVIAELSQKLRNSSDARTSVQCVIVCLEDFASNSKFIEPWQSLHKDLVYLILSCIDYFSQLRRNDFAQNTANFENCIKYFAKLCHVIEYAANQNEPFCTELFNAAAPDFFGLLISKGLSQTVFSMVVKTLSSLSYIADKVNTADTFKRFAVHLNALVRRIFHYEVETQVDLYYILHSSLSNLEEAKKMAAIWFFRWPDLVHSFVEGFSKSLSEGAGLFTSKMHELRVETAPSHANTVKSVEASHSLRDSSHSKVKVDGSNVDRRSKPIVEDHGKNKLKGIQTPYYPDRRKCLSLRTATKGVTANHLLDEHNDDQMQDKRCHNPIVSYGQPKHMKSQRFEEYDFENQSHPPVSALDADGLATTFRKQQSKFSSLSTLGEEDEESKVERWLRASSNEHLSLTAGDQSDVAKHRSSNDHHDSSDNHCGGEGRNEAHKRSCAEVPSSSKRRKETLLKEGWIPLDSATKSSSADCRKLNLEKRQGVCQSLATESNKKLASKPAVEVMIESDEEEEVAPIIKDRLKGRRPLFSKVTEECKLGNVLKNDGPSSINPQGSHVGTNPPKLNVWQQKLKELEKKREVEKQASGDIYQFSADLSQKTPAFKTFQVPTGRAKKSAAAQSNSRVNTAAKVKSTCRSKGNKENVAPEYICKSISRAKETTGKSRDTTFDSSTKSNFLSKKTLQSYSPIADDSMEIIVDGKSLAPGTRSLNEGRDGQTLKSTPLSVERRNRVEESRGEESSGKKRMYTSRVAIANGIVHQPPVASHEDGVKSPVAAKIGCASPSKEASFHESLKSPSPFGSKNKSKDVDSGLEMTSDTPSQCSNKRDNANCAPTKKKESSLSQFLKTNIRNYLKNATGSNSELAKNQSQINSEMVEIKGLAEKIAASVNRCQAVGDNQQKIISGQASSIQIFSKVIETPEERRSKIIAELRARNHARILKAMKTVLEEEENTSFDSSSDTE